MVGRRSRKRWPTSPTRGTRTSRSSRTPATSSPGLAFLLATIAEYGDKGWQDYWRRMRANGVRVVDDWTEAYETDFTAGGGPGDRPIVVSYASSPPADVVFSEPHRDRPRVGVVESSCFRQYEFAGVLHGAHNPAGARALIDFFLSRRFQEDMPLQMYVNPVIAGRPAPGRVQEMGGDSQRSALDGRRDHWPRSRRVDQGVDRPRGAMTTTMKARGWQLLRVVIPLGFLAIFFGWPLGAIFARALRAHAVVDVLGDAALRHVMWFTLWQAVVSTMLTLAVGLPAAYVVARYDFPGKRLFRAFVTVPFVLPTVVVATAFLALLRPGGPLAFLHWQRGVAPMLVAHVFFNVAVVVRTVGGFWANLDPRREEAARMLGASRLGAFRHVTLPLLAPSMLAAASIVFLFTFTSFGVALLLADPAHATIEVEIYRQAVELFDLPTAAALALVQIVAVLGVLFVLARAQERRAVAQRLVAAAETARHAHGRQRLAVGGIVATTTLLLGAPLVMLAGRSFHTGGRWSLASYRALGSSASKSTLFVSPWTALRNSLVFAAIATVLALVIGGLAAAVIASRPGRATRTMDVLLMLPLGTSAVTVGFGFLLAFDSPPLDLSTTPLIIPIAHAIVAIPFVVRIVVPALRSIDPRLRDAATVLGAPPARVWREVDLPIVARAFAVAAGFCAAVSLGEFGATLFVSRPDTPTIPIAIQRFLTRPGELNVGQSLAMATILMALTAAVILVIERIRVPNREF